MQASEGDPLAHHGPHTKALDNRKARAPRSLAKQTDLVVAAGEQQRSPPLCPESSPHAAEQLQSRPPESISGPNTRPRGRLAGHICSIQPLASMWNRIDGRPDVPPSRWTVGANPSEGPQLPAHVGRGSPAFNKKGGRLLLLPQKMDTWHQSHCTCRILTHQKCPYTTHEGARRAAGAGRAQKASACGCWEQGKTPDRRGDPTRAASDGRRRRPSSVTMPQGRDLAAAMGLSEYTTVESAEDGRERKHAPSCKRVSLACQPCYDSRVCVCSQ